jgi:hypothetical protein
MSKEIRILHISDMHFEKHVDKKINGIFKSFLKSVSELESKPHFIAITGDISQSGESDQFESAQSFLDNLLVNSKCSNSMVLMVPGNHDKFIIDNIGKRDPEKVTKDEKEANAKKSKNIFSSDKNICEYVKTHFECYTDFFSKYSNVEGCTPVYRWYPLSTGKETDTEVPIVGVKYFYDYRTAFVLLNTAWLCEMIASEDKGKLTLGENIPRLLSETILDIKNEYGPDVLVISLMHHHPSNFNWENLYDKPGKTNNLAYICEFSNLILSGHDHGLRISLPDFLKNKAQLFTSGTLYSKDSPFYSASLISIDTGNLDVKVSSLEYICNEYNIKNPSFRVEHLDSFTLIPPDLLVKRNIALEKEISEKSAYIEELKWLLKNSSERNKRLLEEIVT